MHQRYTTNFSFISFFDRVPKLLSLPESRLSGGPLAASYMSLDPSGRDLEKNKSQAVSSVSDVYLDFFRPSYDSECLLISESIVVKV